MAAAAGNYKRILQLLEKWPVDASKGERDLGNFLRRTVTKAYKENKFETNHKYWDSQYLALQHIVEDKSKKQFPRLLDSSATGLTAEQCNIALSNEFLEELKNDESFIRRIISSVKK